MSHRIRIVALTLLAATACSESSEAPQQNGSTRLHVLNATPASVELSVDGASRGTLASSVVSPTIELAAGAHEVVVTRADGDVTRTAVVFFATAGASSVSVYAYGPSDGMSLRVLGDTAAAAAEGWSKLRALHLAPDAPPVDIWRRRLLTNDSRLVDPSTYSPTPSAYVEDHAGPWSVYLTPADQPSATIFSLTFDIPSRARRTVALVDSSGALRLRVLEE